MISEEKKRIVIGNYFTVDCDVDTTIREAYELGFDRGIHKAAPVVRRDVLKQVLEIIDKHGEQLVHSIVDGNFPEIKAADVLASVREDVLALKGGDEG